MSETIFLTSADYEKNLAMPNSRCLIINDNVFSIEYITTLSAPTIEKDMISFSFCYNDNVIKNAFKVANKLNDISAIAFLNTTKILSDDLIKKISDEVGSYGDDSVMAEIKRIQVSTSPAVDSNEIRKEITEKFEQFKKVNVEENEKIINSLKNLYSSIVSRKCIM